jgi:hypothetical protein
MVYCASVIRDWIKLSGLELSELERRVDQEAGEKTKRWIVACQVRVVFRPQQAITDSVFHLKIA